MTDPQRSVIEAPIDARQIVLAGAGTGKTEILVRRLQHLSEAEAAAAVAGYELLILSFSRAVVRELKNRVLSAGGPARLVHPLTFDSFATWLLASLPSDSVANDWRERGYDGRIAAAVTALRTSDRAQAIVRDYQHVFVDEIQDLVGVRASLVSALLDCCACGFTLLGDPAQAIYDHQVKERGQTTSIAFLKALRRRYPEAKTVHLRTNFRAISDQATVANEIGDLLRSIDLDVEAARRTLAEVIRSIDDIGPCSSLPAAIRGSRRRIAVLCRDNAAAMRISRHLFESEIPHRLQREATARVLPAWLSTLFAGQSRSAWSRSNLIQLVHERTADCLDIPDSETVWALLTDTVGDDERVDMSNLRAKLRLGRVPDDLAAPDETNVVVSSIHRAKGLQFDDVFIARPVGDVEDMDDAEELRVLYVALSRAREDLWVFDPPPRQPIWQVPELEHRWVRSSWRERWKTFGFEVRSSDLAHLMPIGAGVIEADPTNGQHYLSDDVEGGDPVRLVLHTVSQGEDPIAYYAVRHKERVIGETTERFGRLLGRRIASRDQLHVRWPVELGGLYCDGVETVVGIADEGASAGLGTSGLWLRPRIVGLADVWWSDHDSEQQ